MCSLTNAVERVRVLCNPLPDVGENFVGALLSLQHLDWNSSIEMWIRLLEPFEGSAPVSPDRNRQFEDLRKLIRVRIPGFGLDGRFRPGIAALSETDQAQIPNAADMMRRLTSLRHASPRSMNRSRRINLAICSAATSSPSVSVISCTKSGCSHSR